MGSRGFSLYDIEQFLKEAGSERISESAIVTLEKELEDTVKELVEEAGVYANYAGRRMIHRSDVELVSNGLAKKRKIVLNDARKRAHRKGQEPKSGYQRSPAALRPNAKTTNPISTSHM